MDNNNLILNVGMLYYSHIVAWLQHLIVFCVFFLLVVKWKMNLSIRKYAIGGIYSNEPRDRIQELLLVLKWMKKKDIATTTKIYMKKKNILSHNAQNESHHWNSGRLPSFCDLESYTCSNVCVNRFTSFIQLDWLLNIYFLLHSLSLNCWLVGQCSHS